MSATMQFLEAESNECSWSTRDSETAIYELEIHEYPGRTAGDAGRGRIRDIRDHHLQ